MEVLMKPVDMIATFAKDGTPRPLRLRIEEGDEAVVINVDKILSKTHQKFGQYTNIIFQCQGVINGRRRIFELKFDRGACRWYMYRI